MKVLNLYAGIGGNRKLWEGVDVTAIEWEPKIAEIYQDFFPDDEVIIADAHQYLLDHIYEGWDFIWSSPPCPTHSKMNTIRQALGDKLRYPDMRLYQEILVLDKWFKGFYCVENVISYYDPLIRPQTLGRHYYWSNFYITPLPNIKTPPIKGGTNGISDKDLQKWYEEAYGFDLSKYEQINYKKGKLSVLRNCVYPPCGKHILDCAKGNTQKTLLEL